MSVIYHLSQIQLKALVLGKKKNILTGIRLDPSPLTSVQAVNALNDLVREGVLSTTSDGFKMEPELRSIIDSVTGDSFIALHSSRPELPEMSLFAGQRIVSCVPHGYGKDWFDLGTYAFGELWQDLLDERYFPFQDDSVITDSVFYNTIDIIRNRHEELMECYDPGKPLSNGSDILLSADVRKNNGIFMGYLRIVTYGLYRYIAHKTGDSEELIPYDTAVAEKLFRGMLKNAG